MDRRCRTSVNALAIASALAAAVPLLSQSVVEAARAVDQASETKNLKWQVGRTAWGDPDLQGVWNNTTNTPFERPADLAGKTFLTDKEIGDRVARRRASRDSGSTPAGDPGTYNDFWRDEGITTNRTSLIVDPPDGRIPPLTPEARRREAARAAVRHTRGPSDSWEDRNRWERCLSRGLPMYPGSYNNNFQIFQIPGYVVILLEMIHEVRVVPLDGRPHGKIRQWLGDSRGRWEGDTLVIETINFVDKLDGETYLPSHRGNLFQHRGSGETLRVLERFTRIAPDQIDYSFTMDDPATFTRPWTAVIPMKPENGSIYEYACHEGNYGLVNMLKGARVQEAGGQPDLGGGSWTAGR